MARSYRKNIWRTLYSTKSRFIAIFSIVALGVGFLAGLMSTAPDMKDSMEKYMDDARLYDLRVLSTLGLTDADVQALRAVPGVEGVQAAYAADLLVQPAGVDADVLVARVHSLPADPAAAENINRLMLVEGRWPQNPGECVLEHSANSMAQGFAIGDRFTATPENENLDEKLAQTTYTVVGTVRNACYFSYEREPASVGSGTVNLVFYLQPQDFAYSAYTEIYLTAKDAAPLSSLGTAYKDLVAETEDNIEAISAARCAARESEIRVDAQKEIDDAWADYNDAKQEADTELADAARQLAEGRDALAEGEQKIADGEQDYLDGAVTLAENEQKLNDGIAQLQSAQNQLTEGQTAYEDGWRQFTEGEAQLAAGKKQLEEGQRQYEAGKAAYDAALATLESGEAQLAAGKTTLDVGEEEYAAGIAKLESQKPALAQGRAQYAQLQQLNAGQKAYDAGVQALVAQYTALGMPLTTAQAEATFSDEALAGMLAATPESAMTPGQLQNYQALAALNAAKKQLDAGVAGILAAATPEQAMTEEQARAMYSDAGLAVLDARLTEGERQLAEGEAKLTTARQQLDAGWAEYQQNAAVLAAGRQQLQASAQQLTAAKQQLDSGWAAYESNGSLLYGNKAQLVAAKKTLDDGFATLADKQVELADAQKQLADAKTTLADAAADLQEARETIAEKKQELLDGETDYETAKAEAEQKLADGKTKIEDAEAQLADLAAAEWYVWDRGNNVSFSSFDSNTGKLAALGKVFPLFFFLVAALVVSTTMTRMVEEERLQIGTMKALGYTGSQIMTKYMLYAFAAAAAGTLAGLAAGFVAFPTIIWTAYEMMYYMPKIYITWRWNYALLAGGLLLGGTMAFTFMACRTTLRETPADLMRPRAPTAGKRILLERITFLWRRLPFSYKVTCRNLLRYKKRFWMTVIGVAGCTALLVTGFGISDSLNSIITKQYSDVYQYDLMTAVTKPEYTTQGAVYEYLFDTPELFTASLATATEKVQQELPGGGKVDAYIMVPRDTAAFATFADLHERTTRTPTPLGEQGVVITEKLARALGVQAGDTVTLKNSEEVSAQFTVSGVCEHYVYNYVYMGAATYNAGFGTAPEWNAILSLMPDDSQPVRDKVSALLLAMEETASVNFTVDSMGLVLNMLKAIDSVMVLIIVCAAALAFVVLYNLTNINIAERVKEIATIKVLGFYDREVSAYINRESIALTCIGALVGLPLGVVLHRFIILTVEVDAVMFGREILPLSFVYALALTLVFGAAVDLIMGRKLKKISMVESMKAPE